MNSPSSSKSLTPVATEGQFGKVGRLADSARVFQLMKLAEKKLESKELQEIKADLQRRFAVLEKLRLPFLVKHVNLKIADEKITIETEQSTHFLRNSILDDKGLVVSEGVYREIVYQLLKALSELHSRDVFFGDLNLADVLVNLGGEAEDEQTMERYSLELCNLLLGGVPYYSNGQIFREDFDDPISFPPESFDAPPEPNAKADLYYAGMILCQIAGGRHAVGGADKSQWTSHVPKSLKGFVQILMDDDPLQRPRDGVDALARFDKAVEDRNKLDWRAWAVVAGILFFAFVAGRWNRGSMAVIVQDGLQSELAEARVESERLVEENERLMSRLPVVKSEPNESEVHSAALEIFNRLSKLRDLNNEGDWVKRELGNLANVALRDKVEKRLGAWLNTLSSRQKWTLKFVKENCGKHDAFDFYGYLSVDGAVFQNGNQYLSDVEFQWKPGESITFSVFCNDHGFDSEVKKIVLEGQYALWDLHRQGMGLNGEYDSENWHFEFEVSEWQSKSLPRREGKRVLPTIGF